MTYRATGKIRPFKSDLLTRVLGNPEFRVYPFGLNGARKVVYIPHRPYLTVAEMGQITYLMEVVQEALRLKHVTVEPVGDTRISELRIARNRYMEDLKESQDAETAPD